jgi:hypothetical protein
MKQAIIGAMLAACAAVSAQDIRVSGSIEQAFVSAERSGERQTADRYTRSQIALESGAWTLKGAWWAYPFCRYHELDETGISFAGENWSLMAGRGRLPIGQHTWDDQWYSPFIFLSRLEFEPYGGGRRLSHTSAGIFFDAWLGPDQFQAALTGDEIESTSLLPSRLNRAAVRWQRYFDPFMVGVSAFVDPGALGDRQTLLSADIRWTAPNWSARAVYAAHRDDGVATADYYGVPVASPERQEGFFIDVTHRPEGWRDMTLALRYDRIRWPVSGRSSEVWIAAARLRMPHDFEVMANFSFGPDHDRQPLGNGLSLQVVKQLRF